MEAEVVVVGVVVAVVVVVVATAVAVEDRYQELGDMDLEVLGIRGEGMPQPRWSLHSNQLP